MKQIKYIIYFVCIIFTTDIIFLFPVPNAIITESAIIHILYMISRIIFLVLLYIIIYIEFIRNKKQP